MAREQQVVLRRHGKRVPHEGRRVEEKRAGHAAGYPAPYRGMSAGRIVCRRLTLGGVVTLGGQSGEDEHLGILLGVEDGGDGDAEVGDGTPEIYGFVNAARRAFPRSVERSLGLVRWAYGLSRHS